MKIAIIAPSPIPFNIGGAEKLFLGLQEYINRYTQNQCELIKLPTKEQTFWDIIDSYHSFKKLDLSHFDMVISGKYPAWMVNHPNHHIYMLHPLRGLYDSYDYNKFDKEPIDQKLHELTNYIKNHDLSLSKLFDLLYKLKYENTVPKEHFTFPGAFAKEIIQYLDKKAFENIKSFTAISKTVANRKEYFLKNTQVKVVYPPSNLEKFTNNSYSYFFTASRLDNPKRIDMIIKAYNQSNTTIPLKIAGLGEQLPYLKNLASTNKNIEFLGFVSDKELERYYSDAYAVIFVPQNEDYGLITVEAMMCEKAVLTVDDAGGVTEFVEDRKTGLISKPNVENLAQNIIYLAQNFDITKKIGQNGKNKVKNITWQNCTKELLKSPLNILVIATYPIYPPRGGGQNRIFYLYKELSRYFHITIVSLVHSTVPYSKKEIAPNLYELQIPKTLQHQEEEDKITKIASIAITDIALIDLFNLTPNYQNRIKELSNQADFVIQTSPYTYPLLKDAKIKDSKLIYESQNVEYNLKKSILKDTPYNQKLLKKVYTIEKECYLNSFLTTSCSQDDSVNFKKLYGKNNKEIPFIPNGVDLDSVKYFGKNRKKFIKKRENYTHEDIAIFTGSAHQPNIDAVKEILKLANTTPDILYIIVGGLDVAFKDKPKPTNVKFTGVITNNEKNRYLSISTIALNPMLTGSGTNLKMLDYMASGIPTITTPIGSRGLNIPSQAVAIAKIENFYKYLKNLSYYTNTIEAKRFVYTNYDWKKISNKFKSILLRYKDKNEYF